MPDPYDGLHALLDTIVKALDDELPRTTDDELHNALNQASKAAAHARLRLDTLTAARART